MRKTRIVQCEVVYPATIPFEKLMMKKHSEKIDNEVLLVIRHPVGGIRTLLKYVYKTPYFDDYNFTILLPKGNFTNDSFKGEINYTLVECENNVTSLLKGLYQITKQKKYTLIHSHGFTSGAVSTLFAQYYDTPHLMTSHDVIMKKQFEGLKGIFKKSIVSLLFNRIDCIQSVSNDAQSNFQEMLPSVKRPEKVVVYNGIDIEQYLSNECRNFREELGLSDEHYLIGFLGRFMSQKGFKFLVEAVEKINLENKTRKKPIILSFGSEGFIREEKEFIEKKMMSEQFQFLPPVGNVAPVINGLDAVAMPSLWEAFGLLAVETLICGKPLIASDCIGLREVLADSPAFITPPANAQVLAEKLTLCIENDRRSDFVNYSKIAREKFCAKKTSLALSELYRDLLTPR